jgi:hypothetical protein
MTRPARLFVIAGMPRTGTTSLYHVLGSHPAIFQPYRKEVGYFLFNFARGPEWHRRVYRDCPQEAVGLDVTPEYFFSGEAAERIAATPGARAAIGVRDPAEVASSLYDEYSRRRFGMPPFGEFVRGFEYRRNGTRIGFALDAGDITRMLDAWRRALGDRLLLYDYRLLRREPLRVLTAFERFLDLPAAFRAETFQNLWLNAGARRNSRTLDYLLGRETFIAAIERTVPRAALTRWARRFYELSATPSPPPATEPLDEALARPALQADRAAVSALFARAPIVLGSGAPFDAV